MSAESPRLPTAEETIVNGLLSFRKKQVSNSEKLNNSKQELNQIFSEAQHQIIGTFYNEVKKHITDTGKMPENVSVGSDVKVDLFKYYRNDPRENFYIYDNQAKIACQQIKSMLSGRGFQIKDAVPRDSGWDSHDWLYSDDEPNYRYGCDFKLGPHKNYFANM
jgi:hypothetical protein